MFVLKNLKFVVVTILLLVWIWAKESQGAAVDLLEEISLKDDLTTEFALEIMKHAKAAEIKSMLEPKVDPCTDFYKFACGNWYRSNPAQLLSNIMTDRFQIISKAFNRRLTQLLKTKRDDNPLLNHVKDFYTSCLLSSYDDVKYKLSLEMVREEFGKMPALEGSHWKEDSSELKWWELVAKIQHKYGIKVLLSVDIMGDIKNNTRMMVYVGTPNFQNVQGGTDIIDYLQETVLVKELVKYLGLDSKLAKRTAKEIIEFEHKLMSGGTSALKGSTLESLLTLQNTSTLQSTYDPEDIDFKKFLEIILEQDVPEQVYFYDSTYIGNMISLIQQTPKPIVFNYIFWHLLQSYLISASSSDLPNWCLEKTKKYFGKYTDYIVYKSYKTPSLESEVFALWEEIREAFRDELEGDKLDWISNSTREYALEKLDAMNLVINSYDDEDFESEYGSLSLDRVDFVKNIQQVLMMEAKKKLNKSRNSTSTFETEEIFSYSPAYNILENNIKIPVSFLQPRYLWDANYPQALKYSTIGFLIAHEMIHGFDDEGRNYDKTGSTRSWWDKKSTYEFDSRRKCFQAQYYNYLYAGVHLPESVSQSENIADNGGIKLAYKTYLRWLENKRAEDPEIDQKEILPGLNLDGSQLFFTSFAQIWCDDVQTLFKKSVVSDSHAPSVYRVIGSLSNFQEFSWVFNCSANAPMDPDYKCSIY